MIAYRKREDYMAIEVDIVEAAPFNNPHHPNFVSKEYLGVGGHLFAEATRISFLYGFDGFVKFKAKNDLLFHYQNTLGAIQIGNTQNMYINEEGARKLYERYYKESIFIR